MLVLKKKELDRMADFTLDPSFCLLSDSAKTQILISSASEAWIVHSGEDRLKSSNEKWKTCSRTALGGLWSSWLGGIKRLQT